jgi:hypothetical protein
MPDQEYEVFQSFYSEESANSMFRLLSENGIIGKLEKSRVAVDKVIIGDSMDPGIHLKLKTKDFTSAHDLLNKKIEENIDALDPDYYLYSYSNAELMEIIKKPDEWSHQDFVIAKKILTDRGRELSTYEIDKIRAVRIEELAQPEKQGTGWIILGYIFSVLGSPVGIFFGLFLVTGRKILPDGAKVMIYEKKSRTHGAVIITISAFIIALAVSGFIRRAWVVSPLF